MERGVDLGVGRVIAQGEIEGIDADAGLGELVARRVASLDALLDAPAAQTFAMPIAELGALGLEVAAPKLDRANAQPDAILQHLLERAIFETEALQTQFDAAVERLLGRTAGERRRGCGQ